MNIPLSPCVPENLVSRDGFSRPVRRQPAHLHTQAESGAYLRDSSRVPRRRPFMKPPYAIGSVPSLSGHAIEYRWRSLPRVRRHRASKPQGSSERVLPWQITMDQLVFASLSHTHYWYEVGMLKVPCRYLGPSGVVGARILRQGEYTRRRFLPRILGGRRVILKMGRVLGHIFGGAAVCHPILIFMPLARGAVYSQSRASAWGDEQPGPKVGADTTQKSAMLGVGSGRRRCRGRAVWAFRGSVRFQAEVAWGKRSYRWIRNPSYFSSAYHLHDYRPLRRFRRLNHFRHLRRFCCLHGCGRLRRCRHVHHPSDIRSTSSRSG